jgi:VWFA-related protein
VPDGGTAYLDAAYDAVTMVSDRTGTQRAIVLMTDGVDLNSDKEQEQVIAEAKRNHVKIYTIGIGKPGTQEPITTVLVLDKSGSMLAPANASEKVSKIAALKDAARRFVHTVGSNKRCAVLQFGDAPEMPSAFSNNKKELKDLVSGIKAGGETCLFDALYDAILTLEAEGKVGKRAIVAMTDGIDNKSRRRMEEVVQTAKDAGIRLYLLGFGQPGELDLDTMKRVAVETQGEFHHADSTAKLIQIFEKIADKIHDEGIDEVSLRKLAADTGGAYYPAANVDKLQFIVKQVAQEISDERKSFTFPSVRQVRDGLPRNISLRVIKEAAGRTEQVGGTQSANLGVRGVVIAQMDHFIYLIFLVLIGGLIALPALLKRKQAAA